ncbi:AAA family ATPase [Halobacteriovorax sp. GB3]|uniref:UvrD-helicase domain-containing protein n=1 Tax=Halobacteriovorax sp. GB3 TaxID=2719615 RepID=UPI002362A97A|nr:UvrD-helicase domain-containing protein [Halobacteriovorax sp. GB3]MDD0851810.1 AAA family ATPase [Halobacteriovorax sp. GB3]
MKAVTSKETLDYLTKIAKHFDNVVELIKTIPTMNFDALIQIEKSIEALRLEAKYCKSDDLPGIMDQLNTQHDLARKFSKALELPEISSPFFGHMQINQKGKLKDIYIGHKSFFHKTIPFKILDWKQAPMAKMYYQFDEGDEFDFDVENRTIEGEIVQKSVITIVDGKLYRIDRDGESYLLKDKNWCTLQASQIVLSGGEGSSYQDLSFGTGMTDFDSPDVISLLDKTQFEIVNKDAKSPLLIIGGAGSGKTTVSLFRIARLVEKKAFYPNEAAVLVPNEGLIRLSKSLLDKIGLEKVKVKTIEDLLSQLLFQNIKNLTKKIHDNTLLSVSLIKRNPLLLQAMKEYVKNENKKLSEKMRKYGVDVDFNKKPMDALDDAKIAVFELNDPIAKLNAKSILDKAFDIKNYYFNFLSSTFLYEYLLKNSEGKITKRMIEELKEYTQRQLSKLDEDREYYEREVDGKTKDRSYLDREDVALLLKCIDLKRGSLINQRTMRPFKHLFLDEAQELSAVELQVLSKIITDKGTFTVAGDAVQQIDPTMSFQSWENVLTNLGIDDHSGITKLNVSYRSPREIVDFAHTVLGPLAPSEKPQSNKSGAPVIKTQVQHLGHAAIVLSKSLDDLIKRESRASVAIICNKKETARALYQELDSLSQVRLVENADFSFKPGVDITTVDQIRGLEFDYVIIPDADRENYPEGPRARKRLHLAATRAIYQLWVLHPAQRTTLF